MTETRVGINIRVFALAATFGLAGANQDLRRLTGGYLLLCVIAAIACIGQSMPAMARVVPVAEGALVGMTIGAIGVAGQPLGMYVMVPALLAGLAGGSPMVSATFLAELAAIAAVPIARLQPELLAASLRSALPWLFTAIGIGLLGSWIRRLGESPVNEDHERYVAANQLLSELRVVSRRLSSGLDPIALSSSLLDECLAGRPDGRGAVLIRTQGGVFTSLAQRGVSDGVESLAGFPIVVECWNSARAAQQVTASRQRWSLPLRVGTRMVGVLVLDVDEDFDLARRDELQALLNERALPLDTALLFDEVRTMATVEERHRVAREIHDGIAQEVVSLGYLVDDLASASDDAARTADITRVRHELTRILDDLRLSIFDLRSEVSRSTGLGSVLGEYLQVVGSRCGTAVHLSLDEGADRLRLEVEEELLRIAQEAVTNARKHSGAGNLWVSCRVRPSAADLVVEDDGSGPGTSRRSDGFGMSVMRERADRIGATLSVGERIGGGTRVAVSLRADVPAASSSQRRSTTSSARRVPAGGPAVVSTHG